MDNHVASFHPLEYSDDGTLRVHRIGWRDASTFFGFCESHDGSLFSALENQPFEASDRQILLVGYRALCHELYQKQAARDTESVLTENLDRGLPDTDQRAVQRGLALQFAGRRSGLQEALALKVLYDQILRTVDYSLLHTAVISFRFGACVASTGLVHVDFDLHGNRLQNIAIDPAPLHALTFGILSTADGCAFVAAWPAEFHKCDEFIRSLLSYNEDEIPSLLAEFFFAYVENTYFSEAWWLALAEPNRRRLMRLAGTPVQYGTPLCYSGLRHADLRITNIRTRLT